MGFDLLKFQVGTVVGVVVIRIQKRVCESCCFDDSDSYVLWWKIENNDDDATVIVVWTDCWKISMYSWCSSNVHHFWFLICILVERETKMCLCSFWLILTSDACEQCTINDSLFINCHFRARWRMCWLLIGLIGSSQSEGDTWTGLERKKISGQLWML